MKENSETPTSKREFLYGDKKIISVEIKEQNKKQEGDKNNSIVLTLRSNRNCRALFVLRISIFSPVKINYQKQLFCKPNFLSELNLFIYIYLSCF